MHSQLAWFCLSLAAAATLRAAPPAATADDDLAQSEYLFMVAGDDAAQGEYANGWGTGKNGGQGFGPWTLREATAAGGDQQQSHAGFYLASSASNPDLRPALAIAGKAFGLYANGVGFELATAFRPFEKGLQPGQSFSWLMQHGDFHAKFARDEPAAVGSVGVTLRATNAAQQRPEDYNANSRFEFGFYQDPGAYAVYDGDGMRRLAEVPFPNDGLAITLTLVSADTYDLEVTALGPVPRRTFRFKGRRLAGPAGAPIGSFAVFDRNGETNDLYVNGFQILQ